MLRTFMSAGLVVLASGTVWGQPAAAQPSFEVASIKPAPPPVDGRMMIRMGGGPGSADPGRIDWVNVALRQMIVKAYGIKDYQLTAPEWMSSARFNVDAKIPPNTTEDQLNLMLQGLLAERFGLKIHREQKELPIYALVVGKNGPKLKESTENSTLPGMGPGGMISMGARRGGADGFAPPPPPPSGAGSSGPSATAGGSPGGGGAAFGLSVDSGGGRGGTAGATPRPPVKGRGGMMMMRPGHLAVAKMQLAALADNLTRMLARPVIDMTGLAGEYDFALDWTPDENERGMMPGMPMPMPKGDGGGGGGEARPDSTPGATIFTAVQEQLGLKLDPRKAPIELIVIDHAEKVPTEN
jgi:uncharacterized protein (TIGR03435 family)